MVAEEISIKYSKYNELRNEGGCAMQPPSSFKAEIALLNKGHLLCNKGALFGNKRHLFEGKWREELIKREFLLNLGQNRWMVWKYFVFLHE
jgi:hypothetical protein